MKNRKMMRIALLLSPLTRKSGIDVYIHELAKRLLAEENLRFSLVGAEGDQDFVPAPKENYLAYPSCFSTPLMNIAYSNFFLSSLLKNKGLDLLHIPSIRRMPFFPPTKIVLTIHDLAPLLFPEKYGLARHLYMKTFLRYAQKKADRIIAVSKATKEDCINLMGIDEKKIDVIYSGIDHLPMENKEGMRPWKKPYILYVSRIEHPYKNHLRLIQSFEKTILPNTSYDLLLIGAPWSGAETILSYIKEKNLSKRVHLLGYVDKNKLPSYYAHADLFIFPSLYEGFGFPLLEAMRFSAPIACSNIAIFKEVGKDFVTTFDPYSTHEMGQTMLSLINQKKETSRALLDAHIKKFSWSETVKQTINTYKTVLGEMS